MRSQRLEDGRFPRGHPRRLAFLLDSNKISRFKQRGRLILDNEISRARFAVHYETPYARLILDNEISRARFVVHYETPYARLILDNEISRARFAVHYETPYARLFWITKLVGLDSLSIWS